MDIMSYITELKGLVKDSKMPLLGKIIVDKKEVLDILADMERSIPAEIKEGEALSKDREKILQEAEEKAAQIIDEAKELAIKMTEEHEITLKAHAEAEEINRQANAVASEIVTGARKYADDLFAEVENKANEAGQSLKEVLDVIGEAREQLK